MSGLGDIIARLFGGARGVDAYEAKRLVESRKDLVILDVRQSGEYRGGHLARARHVPVGLVASKAARLDKDATYLVYCLHGSRSSRAAAALKRAGCKNVYTLQGGITAWQRAGFAVTK